MINNIVPSVLHVIGCELKPNELDATPTKSIAELLHEQEKETDKTEPEEGQSLQK